MNYYKKLLNVIIILLIVFCFQYQYMTESAFAAVNDNLSNVFVIPVKGVIDKGLEAFVIRGIREARDINAAFLIFEIDTPGGSVDSAIKISNAILESGIPTVSFINNSAISAGVIIAISSDTLAAVQGATIGAAETRPNEEKYISYWSSALRAVAERTGRDPELVAAMADADVVIEGVKEKGKILSLTTKEALELGLIDKQVNNFEHLLKEIKKEKNIENTRVIRHEMTLSERIAHIASNPYITPVLLTIGIVGTITELISPGFGIPGILGLIAFGIFFIGNIMAGAASSWVLGLFIVGLLLLLIEMFIPGFGVFGVAGILSIIGSIIMAFPSPQQALISITISLIASSVIIYFLVKTLIKTPIFDRIILSLKQEKSKGYIVSTKGVQVNVGSEGKTVTPLRPAGTAIIGKEKFDVLSEGEFIPANADIIVIRVEGNKIFVRKR